MEVADKYVDEQIAEQKSWNEAQTSLSNALHPNGPEQGAVEQQFIKSASRSAGSKKAWETRRKKKSEVAPGQVGGITEDQAQRLQNLFSFVTEKREAYAQAENEFRVAQEKLDNYIEIITVRK